MNRNAAVSVLLLCIALASVVVGVVHFIHRDRAALVEQFAAERTAQVDAAAREVRLRITAFHSPDSRKVCRIEARRSRGCSAQRVRKRCSECARRLVKSGPKRSPVTRTMR